MRVWGPTKYPSGSGDFAVSKFFSHGIQTALPKSGVPEPCILCPYTYIQQVCAWNRILHVMNLTNKVNRRSTIDISRRCPVKKNCQIYNMRFDLQQKITLRSAGNTNKEANFLFTFQQYISSFDYLYLWGPAMMSRLNCPETLPRCPTRGFR